MKNERASLTMLIAYACVLAHLAGCTPMAVRPGEATAEVPVAKAGDAVRITTTWGEKRVIVVTHLTADTICAKEGCIALTDVARVEKISTAALMLGFVIILAPLAVVAPPVAAGILGGAFLPK